MYIQKHIVLLLAWALLLWPLTGQAFDEEKAAKATELLEAYEKINQMSGVVLIAREGEAVYHETFGKAHFELDVPVRTNHKFRIGSITKIFTSILVLQLYEEGIIDLEDPLTDFISDYPGGEQVKIRHLLAHTSGIPNYTDFDDFEDMVLFPSDAGELIEKFKHKGLEFQPGSQFAYSNSGYILLGYILEMVTGKSYDALIEERITIPAGMENTGFDHPDQLLSGRVAGYDGTSGELRNAGFINMSVTHAAGGLYSTTGDLLLLDRALRNEKLLSQEAESLMYKKQRGNYGLGWIVTEIYNKKLTGHSGGIHGFASNYYHLPEDDWVIVVLSNLQNAPVAEISNNLVAILYDKDYVLPKERMEVDIDPQLLERYVGAYTLMPNLILTVSKENGHLYAELTGQPKFRVFPESETRFFYRVVDAVLEFQVAESGEVKGVKLFQGGMTIEGEKR